MSLSRAGVVAGLDMTTEGALTKLAYLLALPESTPETIAKRMSVSLRGELTESTLPIFRHPDGALSERIQTLTSMGYAIAHGDLEKVQTITRTEHHWLLNDADYSGNTPIVSSSDLPVLYRVLNTPSISPQPPPPWTSCTSSSPKAAPCTSAIAPAAPRSS